MSDHAGAPTPPILREFPDRFEAEPGAAEVDTIRVLLGEHEVFREHPWKIIVILPERLAHASDTIGTGGVEVLVRPYPPSQLYAAIGPAQR